MTRPAIGTPSWGDDLNEDLDGIEALAQAGVDAAAAVAEEVAALPGTFASLNDDGELVIDGEVIDVGGGVDSNGLARPFFGDHGGDAPTAPWQPSRTFGPNLWKAANFVQGVSNDSNLAPSVTGPQQTSITRVKVGNEDDGNPAAVLGDYRLRVEFDYDLTGIGGSGPVAGISLKWTNGAGALLGGSAEQWIVTMSSPRKSGRALLDIEPPADNAYPPCLELKLETRNTVTGTMSISNVSFKTITNANVRPLLVTDNLYSQNFIQVYTQQRDRRTRDWKAAAVAFGADGNLSAPFAFGEVRAYPSAVEAFRFNQPDPTMMANAQDITTAVGSQDDQGVSVTTLRITNNDQIIEVWNGSAWELRGNVHNGEYARGDAAWFIDQGAGFLSHVPAHGTVPARRVRAVLNTEMRRSVDGSTPFAEVDRTFTMFGDGMIRCDRIMRFLVDTQVRAYFEWMTTHSETAPFLGRIGRGLDPTVEVDHHPQPATPNVDSVTTSGSGGSLAAGTYSYRVAAFTAYGETLGSAAKTVTTTGATSTATVNWSSVSGAEGFSIYGRAAGRERLLARVPASSTSWIDDGSVLPGASAPARTATAWIYNGTSKIAQASDFDPAWTVYREPRSGWCHANILDRKSVLSRPLVKDMRARFSSGAGIQQKNYNDLRWTGDVGSVTIPADTEWAVTHFSFIYVPGDPEQYHREAAIRSVNYEALAEMYPTT